MKTWKLTVTEDELIALIHHNTLSLIGRSMLDGDMVPERSARIHDLVKRLNKDTPDIEKEEQQPNPEVKNTSTTAQPAASGW